MEAFRETYAASPWAGREAAFVLGFLKDKDTRSMLRSLAPGLGAVVATAPPSPRALPAEELAQMLRQVAPRARVRIAADPAQAFALAPRQRGGGEGVTVVAGSFYLVGAFFKHAGLDPFALPSPIRGRG